MSELICYLSPGWKPLIRPAPLSRDWMDATPSHYAYRCLPLDIANAHGWEVLVPHDVQAIWNGGPSSEDVTVRGESHQRPVSIFGSGTLTFHLEGLFRTAPGWNLWVSGSPNSFKDGIQPLTGVIETDWLTSTFTMNWKFTRPGHWIEFKAGEPFCFFFPVQRHGLEDIQPRYVSFPDAPEVGENFCKWSRARDDFHEQVRQCPPRNGSDQWQKHYYHGIDMDGVSQPDHKMKLRLNEFVGMK